MSESVKRADPARRTAATRPSGQDGQERHDEEEMPEAVVEGCVPQDDPPHGSERHEGEPRALDHGQTGLRRPGAPPGETDEGEQAQ
jgi:hypothetical protein